MSKAGWTVFAGVRKDEDGEALQRSDAKITPLSIDVSDQSSIDAARKTVADALGPRLDALVNNAGIAVHGPLEFVTPDELRMQFEVNVIGLVAATQAFLPSIRAAKGRVINIGSVAGRSPSLPLLGPYSSSKWAVEAITDSMRLELKPWDIEVVLVGPGNIKTGIWDKSDEAFDRFPPEAQELYGGLLEFGRELNGVMSRIGVPAERAAKVVERALTAKSPRRRYLVGIDARWRVYFEGRLPHGLRDPVLEKLRKRGVPDFLKKK
jgi:NAD(P)-dependent dehydrogenase (short-subunit alcohol dehydrogenase family)